MDQESREKAGSLNRSTVAVRSVTLFYSKPQWCIPLRQISRHRRQDLARQKGRSVNGAIFFIRAWFRDCIFAPTTARIRDHLIQAIVV